MFKSRYRAIESLKFMGEAPNQALGPNIEVLVWNVFKCKKKGWHNDFTTLTKNKDLILLQEAIINSPFDSEFNDSLSHEWVMARSFRNIHTHIENGVKTGSSVANIRHAFVASMHSEPFSNTKKMILATHYPLHIQGQSLLVVNTHVINFVSFHKFKTHVDQVFKTIEHHNGPLLLAGDFNTWNRKRLTYFNHVASEYALLSADIRRKPRYNHLWKHLDHIYCRQIEVVHAQVHTEVRSSDHYPISLSLLV